MARFPIDTPVTTREEIVTVDAGLAVGRHRFRLEVIDGEGRRSTPHEAIVEVQRTTPVDPVLPPIGPVTPIIRTRSRRKRETS